MRATPLSISHSLGLITAALPGEQHRSATPLHPPVIAVFNVTTLSFVADKDSKTYGFASSIHEAEAASFFPLIPKCHKILE